MLTLGTYKILSVSEETEHGYILKEDKGDEVLLPGNLAFRDLQKGENVRVFLYKDGEERLTATMQEPDVSLNNMAMLKAKDLTRYGAYFDWGLDKDLLVPHSEQIGELREGQDYLVYLYLDKETNRLVGSMKIDRFLDNSTISVDEEEEVELRILNKTDLGYNVAINGKHRGLIYHDEFFTDITYGEKKTGYIKNIRPDKKIDVTLRPIGYKKVEGAADRILNKLKDSEGFLNLHDKSDPDKIRERLSMSKKTFKKAIGRLYKEDIIRIEENGIYLRD
ncbi:S1-like domain-containing RNA-binding protein [Aliifodinibius salicampi]|uniref:S1-like domain-containing RNA-binding protein n=1 Tax=Fodinibius salicampi TaxID=1920655 RepID=A0ABT3PVU9_9BACT|nr:S1-like domain-containing RNA-binding protein [Fodinibius salicampi]MCW9711985.1 S1-like domain-containing RNA-binding protein [Fodinibius salicampi]